MADDENSYFVDLNFVVNSIHENNIGKMVLRECSDLMPRIYKYNEEFENYIGGAFQNLMDESVGYSRSKTRIKTRLEDNVQYVYFDNDGEISEERLRELNKGLEEIFEGEKEWTESEKGNFIAAQKLKKYGGRISLERISDGEYNVRTVLTLPVEGANSS